MTRLAGVDVSAFPVLVLTGAPGAGKTSLGEALRERGAVLVEQWCVRCFHLPRDWSGCGPDAERLACAVMAPLADAYASSGRRVALSDIRDEDARWLRTRLAHPAKLVSLIADDDTIAARVAGRTSGFTDVGEAVARNRALRSRGLVADELRIDTTHLRLAAELIDG